MIERKRRCEDCGSTSYAGLRCQCMRDDPYDGMRDPEPLPPDAWGFGG